MSKVDWYNDGDGNRVETWSIEKEGHTFHCNYTSKTDWVEVTCHSIECRPKEALARHSGAQVIASLLAGEIIAEHERSIKP